MALSSNDLDAESATHRRHLLTRTHRASDSTILETNHHGRHEAACGNCQASSGGCTSSGSGASSSRSGASPRERTRRRRDDACGFRKPTQRTGAYAHHVGSRCEQAQVGCEASRSTGVLLKLAFEQQVGRACVEARLRVTAPSHKLPSSVATQLIRHEVHDQSATQTRRRIGDTAPRTFLDVNLGET